MSQSLHHPKKPIASKRQQCWAKGLRRRDGRETINAPAIERVWTRMTGRDLEGIRVALGLSEFEISRLLGMEKQNYFALQSGRGMITGPIVKLLVLLLSMPVHARKTCIAFLMSTQPGVLGTLDSSPDVGAILPTTATD